MQQCAYLISYYSFLFSLWLLFRGRCQVTLGQFWPAGSLASYRSFKMLYLVNCLQGAEFRSHRKRAFQLHQGERPKALALFCSPDRISQAGGRFATRKSFRAKKARLSVTKSLLDERAVDHQGNERGRP